MAYIAKADLQKSIEATLLDVLDWSVDDSVITTACSQAESQLRAYLSTKYDIATELAKTTGKDPMLEMVAKDLAIYHIWTYVDPSTIPTARKERYSASLDFLKSAQSGAVSINITAATTSAAVEGGSNTKRINHY